MSIKQAFAKHLKMEAASTRKMLERVPLDKKDWKPHEKSTSLGRLATHIAENIGWISTIIHVSDYDFSATPFSTYVATTNKELLDILNKNVENALKDLDEASLEEFDNIWTVKAGDHILFRAPKKAAIRGWGFDHMIHHRGQLSVYLRLLDVPVPNMYGPTADER